MLEIEIRAYHSASWRSNPNHYSPTAVTTEQLRRWYYVAIHRFVVTHARHQEDTMRIAEKTVELNFCAQVNRATSRQFIWFGLTQRQEAKLGFDACAKIGGRLVILQFKASNYVLKNTHRRFYASHAQMMLLQKLAGSAYRSVFYVLPMIGTTLELAQQPNLLANSWLIDAGRLPYPLPAPTGSSGALRKTGVHYIDVERSGRATVHSDPVQVETILAQDFFSQDLPGADGLGWQFDNKFEPFWEFRYSFGRGAVGLVVVNDP